MFDSATGGGHQPQVLMRRLTLTHAVLYGLGVTIGAGIYVLVGVAAGRAGMHAPIAFALAALIMGLSAKSFAELGTRMPISASEAAYVEKAFNRRWFSLLMGLLVIITAVISAATISAGSAGYIGVFLPWEPTWIIAGVVVTMGLIACLATVHSISFAGVMTVIEVAGLVLIVGAGLTQGPTLVTRLPEMWPGWALAGWTGVASTALIAVFAFIGFEHLVNIAEEMKSPSWTLPRALFLTLGLTAVIYGLVVWVAVTAVPPAELAASPAPLALVFERLTGLPLIMLSAIAIVATLNGVIVHMIMIARVVYGLAQQGNLPAVLGRLNTTTGTPLLATAIGAALIFFRARRAAGRARATDISRHVGDICDHQPGADPHQAQRGRTPARHIRLRALGSHRRAVRKPTAAVARHSPVFLMRVKPSLPPCDSVTGTGDLSKSLERRSKMLEYRIAARRLDAHCSVANAKMAEVKLYTGLAGSPNAFNPAELLLAAIAACMIKGIERVTPMLDFKLDGVEVSLHAVRQDAPPRIVSVDYELVVDTDESDQRLELLHKNVRKYGTISNTIAEAARLEGTIRRKS